MTTKTRKNNGSAELKKHIKEGKAAKLYIIYGEESYLKEYYRDALVKTVVDDTFREFNLQIFEGKSMTPEQFSDAVNSYPAMAEQKLVIVNDFDLYKMPVAMQELMLDIISDPPPYLCLIFYYDLIEFKQDKRTKINALLEKQGCLAEFSHLNERELLEWVRRRIRSQGKEIDDETGNYLLFICGNSMVNLITEIEKVCALATVENITKYHIEQVCTRVLDAVIFDLTDAIAERNFSLAISILQDLISQKNDEIMLFSSIMRHIQRLYAAKLVEQSNGGERLLMELAGSRSPYYIRKLSNSSKKLTLPWLRSAVLVCAETDTALKRSAADRQKLIELTLLMMASDFGAAS